LKNAGWLDDRRCGVWMNYSISCKTGDLQKGVLLNLRSSLPMLEVAVDDRKRLSELGSNNRCA